MASLSSITLPNNNTYDFKDNNAIPKNEDGNTQYLKRPSGLRGSNDLTLQGLFNATRANRLAFLPPDQIIIEKTIDGGTTWTDAEVSDNTKLGLFSETRNSINIPLIDGVRNPLCGIRVTFTAMKYDVPSGTVETAKYNYWNSDYVLSTERYNQIKQFYFWLSASDGSIGVKIEGAKGSSANSWQSLFNDTNYYMTGWSGSDYVRLNSQYVFGGGTNQTGNSFWNYRITFMSKGQNGTDNFDTGSKTQYQNIAQIRAYGDSYWTKGNEYAATDKIYTHDINKNVTFPAKVIASGGFSGNLTGTATDVATQGNGTTDVYRHVWFSDSFTETKRAHDDDFTYNPASNTLKIANIDGKINGHTVNKDVPANAVFTDTTYTASTVSIGSASTGTAISADDITAWTTNTPTAVTPATVVTSASGASASVSNGVLTITNGSFSTGPAATVTPGSSASLSYTSRSIPNISVTNKTVVSGITSS